LDLREILNEGWGYRRGADGQGQLSAAKFTFRVDPEDPVCLCVIPVETQFVGDKKNDQQENGKTNGEAENIDHGKSPVVFEAAKGKPEVRFEHRRSQRLLGQLTGKDAGWEKFHKEEGEFFSGRAINEKTPKVSQGLFKRNWKLSFLWTVKAVVFLDFNSVRSLVLDRTNLRQPVLLTKSKTPRSLS
jgi:hypothetical protein